MHAIGYFDCEGALTQNVCKHFIKNDSDFINVINGYEDENRLYDYSYEKNVCKPIIANIYENDTINGYENVNRLYDCSYEMNVANCSEKTQEYGMIVVLKDT